MKRLFLLFALLFSRSAVEKDRIGTIIIVAGSQQKIVIGADSKATLFSNSIIADGKSKSQCKVATLNGNIIFAIAGRSGHESQGHPEFTWDAIAEARRIAGRYSKTTPIRTIAKAWGDDVVALDNRDLLRGVIQSPIGESQIGLFAGFENHQPIFFQVTNRKSGNDPFISNISRSLPLNDGLVFPFGRIDIASEFAAGQTQRSMKWKRDFLIAHPLPWNSQIVPLVQLVIEKTIQYSVYRNDVGEPIDIVEADASGVHWISQKANCQ